MKTMLVKLLEQSEDVGGYITYVFQILEEEEIKVFESKYMMCVRHPNWDHIDLKKGMVGYLEFKEIRAGIDRWYDGDVFIRYKYDDTQFIRFIEKTEDVEDEFVM